MEWFIYLFFAVFCSPNQVSLNRMVDFPEAKFGLDISNLDGKNLIVKDKNYPIQIVYAADWQFYGDSYFLTITSNKQWEIKLGEALYNNENNRIPLPKKTYQKHLFDFIPKEKGTYDVSFSFDFFREGQSKFYSQSSTQFEVVKDFIFFEKEILLSDSIAIVDDKGDLFYMFPITDFEERDRLQVVMETTGDAVALTTPVFYSTNSTKPLEEQEGITYMRLNRRVKTIQEDTITLKKREVYEIEQFAKDKENGMTWIMIKIWGKARKDGEFKLSWTLSTPADKKTYEDSVDVIGDRLIVSQQGLETKMVNVYGLETMDIKAYTLNKEAQDLQYTGYYVRKDFNKNLKSFSMFLLNEQGEKSREYGERERMPLLRYFQYVLDEEEAKQILGKTKGDRILLTSENRIGYMTKSSKPIELDFIIEDRFGNEVMRVPDITISSFKNSIEDLALDMSLWLPERNGATIAQTDYMDPNAHRAQNSYIFSVKSKNPYDRYDIKMTFLTSDENRNNFEFKDIESGDVIRDTYVWRDYSTESPMGIYIELKDDKMTGYYAVGKYNVQIEVTRLSDNASVIFGERIHIKDDRLAVRLVKSDKETLLNQLSLVEMENKTVYAMHYYNNYLRAFSEADSFKLDTPTDGEHLLFYSKQGKKMIEPKKYHAIVDFVNLNDVDASKREYGAFPIDVVGASRGKTIITYTYKGPDKSEKEHPIQVVVKPFAPKITLLSTEIVDNYGIKQEKVDIFRPKISSIHDKAEPRLYWSIKGDRSENTRVYLEVEPLYVKTVKDAKKPNEFKLVEGPIIDYDAQKTEKTSGIEFVLTPAMSTAMHSYESKVGNQYKGKLTMKIENKTYPEASKVLLQKPYQFKVIPFEGFIVKREGARGHKYSITGGRHAKWINKPVGSYQRWSRKSNERKGVFNCVKWDIDYYKDFRIFKGTDNWGNIYGIETRGTYYHQHKNQVCLEEEEAFETWNTSWREDQPY